MIDHAWMKQWNWYSVIKCAQSNILFWNTDKYKQVWCSSITKHIRWERPRTVHLCCQTFNWSCGKTTETHNQKAFNQISPKNISHIFPCTEILIRVPPGTVSNSASSRKKVAKRGSRNMICSTRHAARWTSDCSRAAEKLGKRGKNNECVCGSFSMHLRLRRDDTCALFQNLCRRHFKALETLILIQPKCSVNPKLYTKLHRKI